MRCGGERHGSKQEIPRGLAIGPMETDGECDRDGLKRVLADAIDAAWRGGVQFTFFAAAMIAAATAAGWLTISTWLAFTWVTVAPISAAIFACRCGSIMWS